MENISAIISYLCPEHIAQISIDIADVVDLIFIPISLFFHYIIESIAEVLRELGATNIFIKHLKLTLVTYSG